jgi:hypothetical protein
MKKLIVMLMLVSCCLLLIPATASASKPTLKSLARSLATLQKTVQGQAATIASLSSGLSDAKATIATQSTTISSLSSKLSADEATITSEAATLATAAPVLALCPYVSVTGSAINGVAGPNVVFKGCNLQIKSATSEDDTSGLGNLIVGWNDESPDVSFRTGSNNLVCGDQNNFNSYGSFLAGCNNATQDPCCSVSGGYGNNTVGNYASVSGGSGNMAGNGACTSVTGGQNNCAFGYGSTVSGGESVFGDAPTGTLLRATDGWSAGGSFHNP